MVKKKIFKVVFTSLFFILAICIFGVGLISARDQVRGRSKDLRIKTSLAQIRTIAQIEYNKVGTFVGVCTGTLLTSTGDYAALSADIIANGGTSTCYALATSYCVKATLKTDPARTFCVDSTGVAKEYPFGSLNECTGTSPANAITCEND